MVRNDIKNSSLLKTKFLIYAFNGRTLFREYSLPEDYHYHYDKYYQEFKTNGHKLDSIFIVKKRGVKLWLIARE